MSRGKEGGTKNYVVFDEDLITIAERNGIPMSQVDEVAKANGISQGEALKMILVGVGLPAAAAMVPQEAEAMAFIGPLAKTFKKEILDKAKNMADEGATRDEIWDATADMGAPTFKDKDGHWKQEISDEDIRFDPSVGGETQWGIGGLRPDETPEARLQDAKELKAEGMSPTKSLQVNRLYGWGI